MRKLTLLSAVLVPFLSMAHEGHGTIQKGVGHYLTSPIHLFGVLALVVAVVLIYKVRTKKNRHA